MPRRIPKPDATSLASAKATARSFSRPSRNEWLEVERCLNVEENGDVDSEKDRLSTVGEGGESGASVVTDERPCGQVSGIFLTVGEYVYELAEDCLLYTSPSPRDS